MGMSPEEIEAAIFDSEQNGRRSEEARAKRSEAASMRTTAYCSYYETPEKVRNGIFDQDPQLAAYLWIQENLTISNASTTEPSDLQMCNINHEEYSVYTTVFDRGSCDNIAVLLSRFDEMYKVSAILLADRINGI